MTPRLFLPAVAGERRDTLRARGIETAVIDAVAAAFRNYPRATEDLDLATFTDPSPNLKWDGLTLRSLRSIQPGADRQE